MGFAKKKRTVGGSRIIEGASSSFLIERNQIHVANTGYGRITFAAMVNSADARWPTWSSCLFTFLCWSASIRYYL